ncbi:hypothetical protein [Haladaptatus sp. DJG-WS-42]|uniref:hypothetical protein n=1 Tax=Haladaptatus sp. DJG-WS-42 TaxID=3120516 RepID=UPI0030CCF0E3
MAEDTAASTPPAPLLVFGLATFHVTLLTTTGLFALHSSASVGRLLAGLDTLTGFVLFFALWAITWWTTRWVLTRAPLDPENPDNRFSRVLMWSYLGGAVTGTVFLVVAIVLVFLVSLGLEIATLVVVVVGIPVAAIVGGLVGAAFGLIDSLIYRLASAFVPRTGRP